MLSVSTGASTRHIRGRRCDCTQPVTVLPLLLLLVATNRQPLPASADYRLPQSLLSSDDNCLSLIVQIMAAIVGYLAVTPTIIRCSAASVPRGMAEPGRWRL